jgi:hypothetical protein
VTLTIPELPVPLDAAPPRRSGPLNRRPMERLTAEVERFAQASNFESLDEANTSPAVLRADRRTSVAAVRRAVPAVDAAR